MATSRARHARGPPAARLLRGALLGEQLGLELGGAGQLGLVRPRGLGVTAAAAAARAAAGGAGRRVDRPALAGAGRCRERASPWRVRTSWWGGAARAAPSAAEDTPGVDRASSPRGEWRVRPGC